MDISTTLVDLGIDLDLVSIYEVTSERIRSHLSGSLDPVGSTFVGSNEDICLKTYFHPIHHLRASKLQYYDHCQKQTNKSP